MKVIFETLRPKRGASGPDCSKAIAFIVDHQLRPESLVEANAVACWLQPHGLRTQILACEWNGHAPKRGHVQRMARDQRYALLTHACQSWDVKHLFVGHHQDDQLETFLMRLVHASGVDGLAGMNARYAHLVHTNQDGLEIIRPFLRVSKDRLVATCQSRGQDYVNDPSNANRDFLRVQARDLVSELGPGFKPKLVKLQSGFAEARDLIKNTSQNLFQQTVQVVHPHGYCIVNLKKLCQAPRWARQRVILRVIGVLRGDPSKYYPPRLSSLGRLQHAFEEWSNKEHRRDVRSLGKCLFTLLTEDKVVVCREISKDLRTPVGLSSGAGVRWGRFQVQLTGSIGTSEKLAVRAMRPDEWDSQIFCLPLNLPKRLGKLCTMSVPVLVNKESDSIVSVLCWTTGHAWDDRSSRAMSSKSSPPHCSDHRHCSELTNDYIGDQILRGGFVAQLREC